MAGHTIHVPDSRIEEAIGGRDKRMKRCKLLYKKQIATGIYGITQGMYSIFDNSKQSITF